MGTADIVTRAHDDIDLGRLGNFCQGQRRASQAVIRTVHHAAATGGLKPAQFLNRQGRVIEDAVIQIAEWFATNGAERRHFDRRAHERLLLLVFGFFAPHPEIDEQVLVRQGNPQSVGLDRAKNGHYFALHCSSSARVILRECAIEVDAGYTNSYFKEKSAE